VEVPLLTNEAGADQLDPIVSALARRGADVSPILTRSPLDLESEARRLVHAGTERLLVAGGDGTLHLAIQAVAASDTVLGLIPVGTGNDFARAIGIPGDIDAACRIALSEPAALDLMRLGDRWVASVATLGFSGDVNARANRMKRPRGSIRYSLATVIELPGMRARQITLELDGEAVNLDAALVAFANTSDFGGGMKICPGADPVDGEIDIVVVAEVGRLRLLRLLRKVFDGSHVELPEVVCLEARRVGIPTPGHEVWADGEMVTTTPTTIEVVPRALRLAGAADVQTARAVTD
jgi:diacylglycerol kinase (ATP)